MLVIITLLTASAVITLLGFALRTKDNNAGLIKLGKPNASGATAEAKTNDNKKISPLILAASEGDTYKVENLIAAGENVNVMDEVGNTPLMRAADKGWTSTVKKLIHYGADLNIRDTQHGWTALGWAIRHCDTDTAKILIAAGIDVNLKDNYGRTALRIVARRACHGIAKALLSAGADLHAKDNDGHTALDGAEESLRLNPKNKSCVEMVEMLKAAGG